MAAASNVDSISLKLLIDTKAQRVLFAEADKNAVDFLVQILTLQMATVIRLLRNQQFEMAGYLANVYDTVENLSEKYNNQPTLTKLILLKPTTSTIRSPLFALSHDQHETLAKVFYSCTNSRSEPIRKRRLIKYKKSYLGNSVHCANYFSDKPGAVCPQRGNSMSVMMTYVAPPPLMNQRQTGGGADGGEEGGFEKGVMAYIVMDDLVVLPMSTISTIALLNKFQVKEVGALE